MATTTLLRHVPIHQHNNHTHGHNQQHQQQDDGDDDDHDNDEISSSASSSASSADFLVHTNTMTTAELDEAADRMAQEEEHEDEVESQSGSVSFATKLSTAMADRDTSNTTRDFDLNNTRQTTCSREGINNTSTGSGAGARDVSILDISPDDEDDEEEYDDDDDDFEAEDVVTSMPDNSILFEELHVELHQEGEDPDENDKDNCNDADCMGQSALLAANSQGKQVTGELQTSSTTKRPSTTKAPSSSPSLSSRGIMNMGGLSLYSVTDTLVDTICASSSFHPCDVKESTSTGNLTDIQGGQTSSIAMLHCHCPTSGGDECGTGTSSLTPAITDIMQILSCTSAPSQSEWEQVWSIRTDNILRQNEKRKDNRPARASIKKRLKRLRGLRMMSHGVRGSSRHGVTFADQPHNTSLTSNGGSVSNGGTNSDMVISSDEMKLDESFNQYFILDKSYTMMDDPLSDTIGKGLEPILPSFDGYDSDPELNCSMTLGRAIRSHREQQQPKEEEKDNEKVPAKKVSADREYDATVKQSSVHKDVGRIDPAHEVSHDCSSPNYSFVESSDPFDLYGMDDNEVRRSVQVSFSPHTISPLYVSASILFLAPFLASYNCCCFNRFQCS
jgi:hypothetical protein